MPRTAECLTGAALVFWVGCFLFFFFKSPLLQQYHNIYHNIIIHRKRAVHVFFLTSDLYKTAITPRYILLLLLLYNYIDDPLRRSRCITDIKLTLPNILCICTGVGILYEYKRFRDYCRHVDCRIRGTLY
jgi:hypothetical protein